MRGRYKLLLDEEACAARAFFPMRSDLAQPCPKVLGRKNNSGDPWQFWQLLGVGEVLVAHW
jgi:hypothetical protein